MVQPPDMQRSTRLWVGVLGGAARALFGVIWAVDAYLTWQPEFAVHYEGYLHNAAQGQPDWLQPWFAGWIALVSAAPDLFLWLTRLAETLLALALLLGLARKWAYIGGALFSLVIWATADGFGGPYVIGAGNPGPALVYVLLFALLAAFSWAQGPTPYSLDYYLGRRWPGWRRVAELASERGVAGATPRLSWPEQGIAIAVLLAGLVLVVGTMRSALTASAATPGNAAAAVTPLNLVQPDAPITPRDAALPPLQGNGDSVDLSITSSDQTVEIAGGVTYQAWTFNGSVPAPVIHVRQGQRVNVTFRNEGHSVHSIDFHAAEVPPDVAYRDVNPHESIQFSFVPRTPGAFLYHCGTAPVLAHIANGMYGAIVVDPQQPLPEAAQSYVLVQGEWYTHQVQASLLAGDFPKMQAAAPDEVVFNGIAFQYRSAPLAASLGQRVRLYMVNAGPNLTSAFHVIGAIFDAVYPDGDPAHRLTGVSTYPIAPGEGAIFDLVLSQPGSYPFVDHSMRDAYLGAVGVLNVR